MDPEETKRAVEEFKALTDEFRVIQLYIHGLNQDFLEINNLDKNDAFGSGSAQALAQMKGDLDYYKELFEKSRFNFMEQDAKEKFLKAITADENTAEFTVAKNQELEAKNAENVKALEGMEQIIRVMNQEVSDEVDIVCSENRALEEDVVGVTRMLREMQEMEAELAQLRSVEDKYSGLTVNDAQALLQAQIQSLHDANEEVESITADIEEMKWRESQLHLSNQKLADQRVQIESRAKEAIKTSALRRPEVEAAYRECLEATRQYQEGVGLESIQFRSDSSSLILEYKILPGSGSIHTIAGATTPARTGKDVRSKGPILTQFLIKLHPKTGRLLSANIENAGCDVKDVIQTAKSRNDIAFLVSETLDRVMKAHP